MDLFTRLANPPLPTVDVATAHARPPGAVLLDVREPGEWASGHAPGAHHRPLSRFDPSGLPAGATVYVICRSGNRSAHVTRALADAGVDARNVAGGMNAWVQAGLPVERG
ncbi:MAG TPA: rhodanese-like domain-containing protein [Acidimicrobiales bacterium]